MEAHDCPKCGKTKEPSIVYGRYETEFSPVERLHIRSAEDNAIELPRDRKKDVEWRTETYLRMCYSCLSCVERKKYDYKYNTKLTLNVDECPNCGSEDAVLDEYEYVGDGEFDVVFECSEKSPVFGCGERFTGKAQVKSSKLKRLLTLQPIRELL